MKRFSLLMAAMALFFAPAAQALPLLDMGLKVGMGQTVSYADDEEIQEALEDSEASILALGVAMRIQVAVLQLEANALYWGESFDDGSYDALSLPLLARFDFAPVPLLKFGVGAGLEFRFPIAADSAGEDVSDAYQANTYLPLSVSLDITIPGIDITTGVEGRYGYELGSAIKGRPDDRRTDYFLLMGTFLF